MNKILIGVIVVLVIIVIIMGVILWKKGQKNQPRKPTMGEYVQMGQDEFTSSIARPQSDVPHETSST